ncbi:NADP-dependent malic enzyme [Tanacetum coccineum]
MANSTFGQANNAYIFPRLGFGLVISGAIRNVSAEALAKQVRQNHYDKGMIYPPRTDIRKISANIAANVAAKAYNLGGSEGSKRAFVRLCMREYRDKRRKAEIEANHEKRKAEIEAKRMDVVIKHLLMQQTLIAFPICHGSGFTHIKRQRRVGMVTKAMYLSVTNQSLFSTATTKNVRVRSFTGAASTGSVATETLYNYRHVPLNVIFVHNFVYQLKHDVM